MPVTLSFSATFIWHESRPFSLSNVGTYTRLPDLSSRTVRVRFPRSSTAGLDLMPDRIRRQQFFVIVLKDYLANSKIITICLGSNKT